MTMDIGNFYLNTPLDRFKYMRINISDVPQEVIDEYKLYENNYVVNGCVYVEIRRALFGLKQSVALANKQLSKVLGKKDISMLSTLQIYGCIRHGIYHSH
jgi:hypothetical protein